MAKMTYFDSPALYRPYLIAGFGGWPNAAEVSSSAVRYLIENLEAKRFASIPQEDFYDMTSTRPVAAIKGGKLTELKLPGNTFYYSNDRLSRHLILFEGIEPHLRWNAYVNCLFGIVERFEVEQIYTLGGTYDFIPHSHPSMVSAVYNDDVIGERIKRAGLELTDYTGPISIHTFIMEKARKKGILTVGLWGHAPQYLQGKNVRVVYALLKSLTELMEVEIDLSELQRSSDYFDQQVNHLVEQDPKLQDVIGKLEEAYQRSGRGLPARKNGGQKDEKVVYIRAFLKRQDDEET
jgi:proteasome assembly chaperone (PAC2) family protein